MPSLEREPAKRLPFLPRNLESPPLRELLSLHRKFRFRQTLPGNIGDGFLYATNPTYKNVRDEFLRRGFSFTKDDFCRYFDFPMMCLDDVLAARTLPYRDNFACLADMERRRPGVFHVSDLSQLSPNFNYLFHESAHCIAHSVFFGKTRMQQIPKTSESLLKILLGESFANAVECISGAFRVGAIGGYFLSANCHFSLSNEGANQLREGIRSLGFPAVTKTILASFLYSNFMYRELTPREQDLILEFSGTKRRESIRAIARTGFDLNPQFRTSTTPLHLLKVGFGPDVEKMIQFDPLEFIAKRNQADLRLQIEALVRVI